MPVSRETAYRMADDTTELYFAALAHEVRQLQVVVKLHDVGIGELRGGKTEPAAPRSARQPRERHGMHVVHADREAR
jgi:hypothetical protein